jgi:hypothetical protein
VSSTYRSLYACQELRVQIWASSPSILKRKKLAVPSPSRQILLLSKCFLINYSKTILIFEDEDLAICNPPLLPFRTLNVGFVVEKLVLIPLFCLASRHSTNALYSLSFISHGRCAVQILSLSLAIFNHKLQTIHSSELSILSLRQ